MTPGELADKLTELESKGHMNTMDTEMFLKRDIILKSLRFAADMELLKKYRAEFHEAGPQTRHRGPWGISIMFSGGSVMVRFGTDIYTAARKAVEALEKGEA